MYYVQLTTRALPWPLSLLRVICSAPGTELNLAQQGSWPSPTEHEYLTTEYGVIVSLRITPAVSTESIGATALPLRSASQPPRLLTGFRANH